MSKKVIFNNLIYSIQEVGKTASLIGSKLEQNNDEIIIPRLIKYETKEYIITSISKSAFARSNIKSVKFSADSEVRTFEKRSFSYSNIESLSIPASVIDIKDEWCYLATKLCNITIDPNNPRYSMYDNKIIIGKSDINSENFDILVSSVVNIQEITIPAFIKIIESYAFEKRNQLQDVKFAPNSELQIIGKYSFERTPIQKITIPSHL